MNALDSLRSQLRSTATLASAASLLGWDEQTYMPPAGGPFRAEQQGMLAGMIHGRQTDPRVGAWLAELEGSGLDPDSAEAALVREVRRDFDLATKLPQRLVEELSEVTSLAQQAWVAARKANDFAAFEPHLTKIVALKREEAAALSEGRSLADPYDALLDQYEAHATTAEVAEVFENLRPPLVTLVADIADRGRANDAGVLTRSYPVDVQRTLGEAAAAAIGFDFDAGRLDVTAHPFCTDIGPGDVRLTTRYDERFFPMAFFGTLHEAGHGLYEQGLPHDAFGTPLGQAASLGVHESQSRMWENLVGRSRAFWGHWFPQAQAAFPGALGDVDEDAFYRTINRVEPSFIRVEADEVTYNLHVMLRFDLERKLIGGDLAVADLPAAWDETFRDYFGITPPDVSQGCLQDVHWSAGLIGYFPTYALGNIYASQLFEAAKTEIGDLERGFAEGDYRPLLDWLRENVHTHGRRFAPAELVERVTGRPLESDSLLNHLHTKYSGVYGI